MHLNLFWPITTQETILFHLALWYCLYYKLSSHIPRLWILFSCIVDSSSFSHTSWSLFLCSHWRPSVLLITETSPWILYLEQFRHFHPSPPPLNSQRLFPITFTTLENFYFYSFPVLLHSSSHVYILYFNWIINSEQARDCLHVFDSVLVSSANRAPKVIITMM